MWKQTYKDCLEYIDIYWDKIIHSPTRKNFNHNVLTIPYEYVTPNDKKFDFIYYWDSFFMFRGLMGTKREGVIKDMVNNFAYLLDTYHVIPNFNSHASINRSQPPFFSSMIFDAYFSTIKHDHSLTDRKEWLKKTIELAKKEYANVWVDPEKLYHHTVEGYTLNRYGDRDIGYAHSSELESGWDMTSRFYNRCNEFLAVDLNVYLYKYEWDFARAAKILGENENVTYWETQLEKRKEAMNTYMWNEKEGFFYDYGYAYQRQSDFLSLAGFTPLWAGIATPKQAKKMLKKLSLFESDHGLFITAKKSLPPKQDLSKIPKRYRPAIEEVLIPKQWDYPHIWPPLEYLTVIGLLRYGYINDATRIMKKSIESQATIFRKYGTFYEKIDGVEGDRAKSFHYENQGGFGWTNAVFYRYIEILDILESGETIYKQPQKDNPPYHFGILH